MDFLEQQWTLSLVSVTHLKFSWAANQKWEAGHTEFRMPLGHILGVFT